IEMGVRIAEQIVYYSCEFRRFIVKYVISRPIKRSTHLAKPILRKPQRYRTFTIPKKALRLLSDEEKNDNKNHNNIRPQSNKASTSNDQTGQIASFLAKHTANERRSSGGNDAQLVQLNKDNEYIHLNKNKDIFLIICDENIREFIPLVHDLSQVYSVFIYCSDNDIQLLTSWSQSYPKSSGVFSVEERLLYQLVIALALYCTHMGDAYSQSGNFNLADTSYQKSDHFYNKMIERLQNQHA
ncbi:unnamed protein product, partial [Didymodactylos carnosus]